MKPRRSAISLLFLILSGILLIVIASCSPAATVPPAQSPAEEQPEPQPAATGAPPAPTQPVPTQEEVIEGRLVEMEWPESMRLDDSDVIRLALVPSEDGYVARAEFPDHSLQTKEVPVPRPNGYILYASARLDGAGFDIAPTGDQERYVPVGEEVAWRWSLAAQRPGQHRLSVQLYLRWIPGPGIQGEVIESQVFARGLDVQVTSFFGLSAAQAATGGMIGVLLGSGFLLVALVWRASPQMAAPASRARFERLETNPAVRIETPPKLTLADEEAQLLRALFGRYDRMMIEDEFLSGYSGARTFLVRPIRPGGEADAQTIVKLGHQAAIQQEFENYENFVKDRLPPITARIQRPPVTLKARATGKPTIAQRAAMQYTFIAEPGRSPVSLRRSLLDHVNPAEILRLFETFGPSWWMQRRPATFRLSQEYDSLLPPHFVLEPQPELRSNVDLPVISESSQAGALHLPVGALCLIQSFSHAELRADGQSLSLAGIPAAGQPPLRLRWLSNRPPQGTPARIVATRMDLLRGYTTDLERFSLPDPLERLPSLLDEMVSGTYSVIHGDLNLENILVGPGNLVWLIDFAQTREGHPLYDFAHLESELIAHVLSIKSETPWSYLQRWQAGQDPLLSAVHSIAARCLFDPARPREYHLSLAMACLGALKYPNLSQLARHCLYLTAADLIQTL